MNIYRNIATNSEPSCFELGVDGVAHLSPKMLIILGESQDVGRKLFSFLSAFNS